MVPKERFDHRTFRPAERLAAFRKLTAPLFDSWPLGDPAEFKVDAISFRVEDLLFQQVVFSPTRFLRGPRHLQGNNKDFMVLEAQLEGDQRLVMAQGPMRLLDGHIYLRDWACPFESFASAMRLNSIVIPRHRLTASASMTMRHPVISWPLAEPAGRLLSMLWAQLLAELAEVTLPEAKNLTDAFLGFLDALIGSEANRTTPSTLGAMQQYLNARLLCDVKVEDLCEHFHVSRSKIYRLFEPMGGVRHYITGARLDRCCSELMVEDPSRVKLADVASRWGFHDASSFTRAFRSRFGTPPSKMLGKAFDQGARDQWHNGFSEANVSRNYMNWLQVASGRRPEHA